MVKVDHLIAMMVIEHLFDPFHAFREIKRCVSNRGAAYVNLPLVTGLRNRARLLIGKIPETSIRYERWFANWNGMGTICIIFRYARFTILRDLAVSA